jgi:phosphopantothenoylcysteine decarboxylase/phosphopantothenate--cysteine ligase
VILTGKKILLGVTGGIAAYKAVEVVRRLKNLGADVVVIMTKAATEFVTPLTFETISEHPVSVDLFADWRSTRIEHIALSEWPDLIVIAPATANIIGKISSGIADDLLTTTVMAATAPVIIAPAMHTNMFNNPIVMANIRRLQEIGYRIIPPDVGQLASGGFGIGRLAELEVIVDTVCATLVPSSPSPESESPTFPTTTVDIVPPGPALSGDLTGVRVVVTAGRTEEDLDPVRFLTNRSTGKMGYAIADRARVRGADVHLISGPSSLAPPAGVTVEAVRSAGEMHAVVLRVLDGCDLLVMAAAVSDFRPKERSSQKIKKTATGSFVLELVQNPDIAADVGRRKGHRVVVGFAVETENDVENARRKLEAKNLDLIVINNPLTEGAAFGHDTNVVTILSRDGAIEPLPMMSKGEVADRILDKTIPLLRRK